MDAVELSCPLDVSVPVKLMGSEGCGGVRVSPNKTESNCEKVRVSMGANPPIERCSSSISKKDGGSSSNASDSSPWRKLIHSHDFVHERLTKLCVENTSEPTISVCKNGFLPNASPESRKTGKLSRSSSGASKRTKLILLDTVSSPRDNNDMKDMCEQGSTLSDKPQVVKQRNGCSSRRSDKRNSKLPARTFSTLNSASGQNAFFGAYGLKPEINDVTKLIEDLSLKKLLEGSCECPALGKDKMIETTNDTFLTLVRTVWSVLPTPSPVQPQNSSELDSCTTKPLDSPSSVIVVPNDETSKQGNAPEGDLSSSSKDHSDKSEMPSTPLNFPLCEPTDVLKRLSLPPSKDLDSLLQDASKPSQCSKNNPDQRSSKQLPARVGLPHFPWSHSFNGNCKTNSEAAKLLFSRTLCQGRWLKIPENSISPTSLTDTVTNLASLTFNRNLIPSLKQTTAGGETSGPSTRCKCVSSASLASLAPNVSKDEQDDDSLRCPRLLAAAQTLYDMAIHSQNHNPNGILRWPKKLSQKSMKARKSKFDKKTEEIHGRATAMATVTATATALDQCSNGNQVRKESMEHPKPSKRPRLSSMENKKTASSSSSNSSKHSSSSSKIKNHSYLMLPPPSRTPEKPSICQQKARKAHG